MAAADKARLQAQLSEAADARATLEAQLAALTTEMQSLRSRAAVVAGP